MATFLFGEIVFGPVTSRRLGASLGINLLPEGRKICNFNCIYCECGWSDPDEVKQSTFPSRQEIADSLGTRLHEMKANDEALDTITFAGNGEPTLHPDFPGIIEDTVALRNALFPKVEIAVLSNATRLGDPLIREAIRQVEQRILKIDSAYTETVSSLNQPKGVYDLDSTIEQLKTFKGEFTLQTLFVRGSYKGRLIDNSDPESIRDWLKIVAKLKPQAVMVYTIARDTPIETLHKVSPEKLDAIANEVRKLGSEALVSY